MFTVPFKNHLNFFRIHLVYFTFTPLIFSAIFYASNGEYHISYIDALFNSVSAMTVCGLATVDLSSLTGWQQTILFLQMCLGNPVIISWVVVYVRRRMFKEQCEDIVRNAARRVAVEEPGQLVEVPTSFRTRILDFLLHRRKVSTITENDSGNITPTTASMKGSRSRGGETPRLRPDMIRRIDDAPKLVNPSGWISEGRTDPLKVIPVEPEPQQNETTRHLSFTDNGDPVVSSETSSQPSSDSAERASRRMSASSARDRSRSLSQDENDGSHRIDEHNPTSISTTIARSGVMPRTQTVEFAPTPRRHRTTAMEDNHENLTRRPTIDTIASESQGDQRSQRGTVRRYPTLDRTGTMHTSASVRAKHTGFGGFPWPHEIISSLLKHFFPDANRRLTRTLTMPRTMTVTSQRQPGVTARVVPYISFDAVVGRNSVFHSLTNEQLEELGGVEYRALTALLWIVAGYHILVQTLALTIIGPYMTLHKWREALSPPAQHRFVPPGWFSAFQVVSAYTNTGMSLCDKSMLPFQKAYPMIVVLVILILAGNTAFPIFLRFSIWSLTKVFPSRSQSNETLHFLLDHPRRCFIYLFPSHQTWFLLTVLLFLNATDWFFFLVLDIGNQAIDTIPLGVRFIDGLLQATAVRAAGFGTVTLSALAPAVKVLYVIMMYISVYPIAMSVRSTNVYEEKSLGIYHEESDDEDEDEEAEFARIAAQGSRMTVWSRYLTMHARKQLAFDMWWLGLGLFLVCIIERSQLNDEANQDWFNIFDVVFELVSAYGTVGLSLGVANGNYSLSGAFSPLSKLIVCLVMLRGRHRGLPVAIDRAVVLPFEFRNPDEDMAPGTGRGQAQDRSTSPTSRRRPSVTSSMMPGMGLSGGIMHNGGADGVSPPAGGPGGEKDGIPGLGAGNERRRRRSSSRLSTLGDRLGGIVGGGGGAAEDIVVREKKS